MHAANGAQYLYLFRDLKIRTLHSEISETVTTAGTNAWSNIFQTVVRLRVIITLLGSSSEEAEPITANVVTSIDSELISSVPRLALRLLSANRPKTVKPRYQGAKYLP